MQKFRGLENKKILVVEDVELNQYLAKHIMESWGCIVNVAENGEQAIVEMSKDRFDLVLMDIQMPIMDGIEATKRIRQMNCPDKSTVPIVALTANAMPDEFDLYRKAGMNDCLRKPFEEPALFKIVSKYIQTEAGAMVVEEKAAPKYASDVKLYDLKMVEMISGGDHSFVVKMLHLFLETVPATLKDMRTATKKSDWIALSKVAHKLKSTIDSMGIARIKPDIRTIEENAKKGIDVNSLPAVVNNVISVMEMVMVQVKKDHSL